VAIKPEYFTDPGDVTKHLTGAYTVSIAPVEEN
jgi:hypothetical protein